MIEGELPLVEFLQAVAARVVVPEEHVGAGESHDILFPSKRHVAEQSKHGRDPDGDPDGPHFVIGLFDHFDFALEKQLQCLLPGHDMERFVGRVQDERVRHTSSMSKFPERRNRCAIWDILDIEGVFPEGLSKN